MKTKRKNPNDSTFRNINALKKRYIWLVGTVENMQMDIDYIWDTLMPPGSKPKKLKKGKK